MLTQTIFTIDATHPEVKKDLVDCHGFHKRTMRLFSHVNDTRDINEVLYRVDPTIEPVTLLVQAQQYPDVTSLPHGYAKPPIQSTDIQAALDAFVPGQVASFVLIANPTKKSLISHQRVDLTDPGEIIAWLDRRMVAAGCQIHLSSLKAPKLPAIVGVHPKGKLTFSVYRFSGVLTITDVALLQTAMVGGIGPGKAYGCGLLTLH
jgi:CRISPR system Cascade subunit CasE